MASHREKSFIATVSSEFGTLGHFSQLHTENLLDPFIGFSWFGIRHHSAAHMLGHVGEHKLIPPLHWYFRSTDSGYAIFVRSQRFFGRFIGYRDGYFGAFGTEAEGRSMFSLEPVIAEEGRYAEEIGEGGEVITRLISRDTGKSLCLRDKLFQYRAGKRWQQKRCTYITADGGKPLHLRLHIVQTNAPYIDNPNER
ncbi:hypothetical protein [Pseudomonas sp. BBP2017]|uniref:hypothetical protein n=1 Tax=Pseudomonas sp. BBP2017 TaxID=2109731 RepID=UPI000D1171DF|nr:hypothetical protein [Pseudomonas sp. BBP2017]PSS53708.1 hypothetical protein C6382_15380 [Pseudomonas sp. BBP2017]